MGYWNWIRFYEKPQLRSDLWKKSSLSGARTHKSLGSTESWLGSIEFAPTVWIFKKFRLNLRSKVKISRLYTSMCILLNFWRFLSRSLYYLGILSIAVFCIDCTSKLCYDYVQICSYFAYKDQATLLSRQYMNVYLYYIHSCTCHKIWGKNLLQHTAAKFCKKTKAYCLT